MEQNKENKGWFKIGNSASSKKWVSQEDLQIAVDDYFDKCDCNIVGHDAGGKPITEPYTIEGLALHLDCCRDTLLNYEKAEGYEPYFDTIKKAKLRVQHQKVVNGLIGKSNSTITIFDLKNNHGYKDKTEIEQKTTNINPLEFKIIE